MLSGMLVVALDFLVYYLFLVLGVPYLVANIFAFCVCNTTEYFINKHWVFEGSEDYHPPSFPRFIAISLGILALSSTLLAIFVESHILLQLFPGLSPIAEKVLAKVLTLLLVSLVDFLVKKFMVFEVRK